MLDQITKKQKKQILSLIRKSKRKKVSSEEEAIIILRELKEKIDEMTGLPGSISFTTCSGFEI